MGSLLTAVVSLVAEEMDETKLPNCCAAGARGPVSILAPQHQAKFGTHL